MEAARDAELRAEALEAARKAAEADAIDRDLRTASELAHELGISRQRLHKYVIRAGVEPVEVRGIRRYYDRQSQIDVVVAWRDAFAESRRYRFGPAATDPYWAAERWRHERLGYTASRLLDDRWPEPPVLVLPAQEVGA